MAKGQRGSLLKKTLSEASSFCQKLVHVDVRKDDVKNRVSRRLPCVHEVVIVNEHVFLAEL